MDTKNRRVCFIQGTAPPKEVNLAISISSTEIVGCTHIPSLVAKNITNGHIIYTIDVWQCGQCWQIKKRFSDFVMLHEFALVETGVMGYILPPIPSRTWTKWYSIINYYQLIISLFLNDQMSVSQP